MKKAINYYKGTKTISKGKPHNTGDFQVKLFFLFY